MDDANRKTINAYNQQADRYVARTSADVPEDVQAWLTYVTDGMGSEERIFEIGSGPGRDAAFLREKGFLVVCSDAAPSFVQMMQRTGQTARVVNILTDSIPDGPYDLIIANAVLLHFQPQELSTVFQSVNAALKPGGRFTFSFIEGEGGKWTKGKLEVDRYFQYFTREQMSEIAIRAGFVVTWVDDSQDDTGHTWVRLIVTKQ